MPRSCREARPCSPKAARAVTRVSARGSWRRSQDWYGCGHAGHSRPITFYPATSAIRYRRSELTSSAMRNAREAYRQGFLPILTRSCPKCIPHNPDTVLITSLCCYRGAAISDTGLANIWATAPFLHNTGIEYDPSVREGWRLTRTRWLCLAGRRMGLTIRRRAASTFKYEEGGQLHRTIRPSI
jgi:hypothetical protein